jgi:hypothetical protein
MTQITEISAVHEKKQTWIKFTAFNLCLSVAGLLIFSEGCKSGSPAAQKEKPIKPAVYFWMPEAEGEKNLMPNPSFENGDTANQQPAGWEAFVGAKLDGKIKQQDIRKKAEDAYCKWTLEESHTGKRSLMLFSANKTKDAKWISEMTPIKPEKIYNLQFWLKLDGVKHDVWRKHWYMTAITYSYYGKDKKYILHRDALKEYGTSDWVKYSNCFKTPPEARYIKINFALFHTEGKAFLDDISLKNIPKEKLKSVKNPKGREFHKIVWGNKIPDKIEANATCEELEVFKKANNDEYFPDSRASKDELIDALKVSMAQNETSFATFGVTAPPNLKEIELTLDAPKSNSGATLPISTKDIRLVKYWPQRNLYKGDFYYLFPELLLKQNNFKQEKNSRTAQFWIEIKTDNNTKPGDYNGTINIRNGKNILKEIPLSIKILPFKLEDSKLGVRIISLGSPKNYKDIELIFKDLVGHGINSLAFSPDLRNKFTIKDGKLKKIDFSSFDKILNKWQKTNGKRGIIVLRFGASLEKYLGQAMGLKPEVYTKWENIDWPENLKENFKTALKLYKNRVNGFGYEFYYSGMDEAGVHPKVQEKAILQHKLAKEAGAKTYNTCDVRFTNEKLDPYIDARSYQLNYLETMKENEARRMECKKSGDKFFFYGSGTYMEEGKIPNEGSMVPNRYLNGFFACKTKADGHHVWGYNWGFGNTYDDFDSTRKDFFLSYPSQKNGKPDLISTIQWEGVREGINDAKFIMTLQEYINKAIKSNSPQVKAAGLKAQSKMKKIMRQVPWQNEFRLNYSKYTDSYFNALRNETINAIEELLKAMKEASRH